MELPPVSPRSHLLAAGLAAGLIVPAGQAAANDSTAELATGGLVLTKTADIEMRSEDLFISTKEIRVTYRFRNTSAQDKTVTVAFPMPDITLDYIDNMTSVPHEGVENFLDFSTKADGRPVTTHVEVKAFADGVDQTDLLRRMKIPLYPSIEDETLDKLPPAEWDRFEKLGLGAVSEYDGGKGWEKHLTPAWTLKTTYYFEQTFPAGRDVTIEHRYTPSVGASAGTSVGQTYIDQATNREVPSDAIAKYCVDSGMLAAVARAQTAAKQDFPPFTEERIAYVLKTGANWAAPIGDFRLVIDKGAAHNLLSLCAEGVKKISPTQFEIRRTNYSPAHDLDILILMPYQPSAQ